MRRHIVDIGLQVLSRPEGTSAYHPELAAKHALRPGSIPERAADFRYVVTTYEPLTPL